jgi:hypothetical protein
MELPDFTEAACVNVATDLFFPETAIENAYNKEWLRGYCYGCKLFEPCLEYSLAVMVDGIWAGNDALDRRAIRRARGTKAQRLEQSLGDVFQSTTQGAKAQRLKRAKQK